MGRSARLSGSPTSPWRRALAQSWWHARCARCAIMRVLVATDGSAWSEAAVGEVARRRWPAGSEVRIVSVFEPPLFSSDTWSVPAQAYRLLEATAAEHACEAGARAAAALRETGLGIACEVIAGSARRVILERAEEFSADLIIVGSHGNGLARRLRLGSVSSAIVSRASCSVEVVRRQTSARDSASVDGRPPDLVEPHDRERHSQDVANEKDRERRRVSTSGAHEVSAGQNADDGT